jgi:hypothetical protein
MPVERLEWSSVGRMKCNGESTYLRCGNEIGPAVLNRGGMFKGPMDNLDTISILVPGGVPEPPSHPLGRFDRNNLLHPLIFEQEPGKDPRARAELDDPDLAVLRQVLKEGFKGFAGVPGTQTFSTAARLEQS